MWKKSMINFAIFFMIIFNIFLWGYLFDETGLVDKVVSSFETEDTVENGHVGGPAENKEKESREAAADKVNSSNGAEGNESIKTNGSSSGFEVVDIK